MTVLGRMVSVNGVVNGGSAFGDVQAGMYYIPYINWAVSSGITKGYEDGSFKPDQAITRQEMAVMLGRFLKATNKTKPVTVNNVNFADSGQFESWARAEIMDMAAQGLIKGMPDGSFAPRSPFTRAQVAQVLYNLDH
ncbi:MAG: S-layer homology domain-containing protein [Tissierellia bacterium]|nr:S-layer homology domain-containing protein [Tissierellia bacterium]